MIGSGYLEWGFFSRLPTFGEPRCKGEFRLENSSDDQTLVSTL